ncbi:uncharacterized protein C8Q71DRAFT_856596 [Rhodofomes roseus]|uniref:Fungal-type protein kinase domain-containing protein n=1 Tax=Rhodofomes roseus TaxID=34475 RepID=A0ABQ8KL54_9APHY|nr:uncharacterized protein C8Q71DRAFT_856596 [Rhodofomes roseus]KAH9838663.1 hypothetical protein C8Q71DRAFT_856596 [Rhodofomes roseus]
MPSSSDMYDTMHSRKSGTGTSEVDEDPWAAEIDDKVNLFNKNLVEFFDAYVPCEAASRAARPWDDPATPFETVPTTGEETKMYPEIIKGLDSIVRKFKPARRPRFAVGSKRSVRFPYSAWEYEHNYTLPDILMSFPAEADEGWQLKWRRIAMAIEVKPTRGEDPIGVYGVKYSNEATGVLTQIAKSARNLMLTHGMLYVYIIGIYCDTARIYRFDHAACVVSRAFNYKNDPSPLHELLWRFCHHREHDRGRANAPLVRMVLGADPSLQPVTEEEVELADEKCAEAGKDRLTEDEKQACRWTTVIRYNKDGSEAGATRYLLYRLRFMNPRLFSRSTAVWDAFEEGTWEPRVIKEAWRQLARDREDALYDRLRHAFDPQNRPWWANIADYVFLHRNDEDKPTLPDGGFKLDDQGCPIRSEDFDELEAEAKLDAAASELYGLPSVTFSDDLGAREAAKLLSKQSDSPLEVSDDAIDALASGVDHPPAYDVYHRTICGWLRDANKANYNERSHMRVVMKTTGRPLCEFRSTRELVEALRDVVIGHRQLFQQGIIHRDISEGNVMIYDGWIHVFVGFLLDLDYAFDWKTALKHAGYEQIDENAWKQAVKEYNKNLPHRTRPAPPEKEIPLLLCKKEDGKDLGNEAEREAWKMRMRMKEQTGTLLYMAIEILCSYVAHDIRHDLESVFWLLLCMVLRHTRHTCYPAYQLYIFIFGASTEYESAMHKRGFLTESMEWEVEGNKPLTTLIRKYKHLCCCNIPSDDEAIPLTYESVLDLFDEALADVSWPENDRALPFKIPGDSNDSSAGSQEGWSKTRTRESETSTDGVEGGDPWRLDLDKSEGDSSS